jgi:hypothetical protein
MGVLSDLAGAGMFKRKDKGKERIGSMDRTVAGGGGDGSIGSDEMVPSYKRGGKVRKTGLARLHKGEYVVPKGRKKSRGKR